MDSLKGAIARKEKMKEIKKLEIKREFFELIKSGKKEFEFRKLEKGLTKGVYLFIDSDTEEELAHVVLMPKAINPRIDRDLIHGGHEVEIPLGISSGIKIGQVDSKTYKFVYERYIKNTIDFVCYKVDIISEGAKEFIETINKEKGGE